ncbi:hypothetical protein EIP86_007600 [Pleurotus ostreatoroseus]|nr:hypothetical protein EIP86_007600 [Pleurotus ostreatoroseus]
MQLRQHMQGERHRRQIAGLAVTLFCSLCRIAVVGQNGWQQHLATKRHLRNAKQQGVSAAMEPMEAGDDVQSHEFCPLCKVYVHTSTWTRHPATKMHKRRLRFGSVEAGLEEAAKDKHGILVTPSELDFGVLHSDRAKHGVSLTVEIKSSVPLSNVTLVEYKLSSASFNQRRVVYGRPLVLTIRTKQSNTGIYYDRVELIFRDTKLNQQFVIARSIKAVIGDPDEYAAMQPKTPFVPRRRFVRDPENEVLPGDPPPAQNVIQWVVKLGQYPIPSFIADALSRPGSLESTIGQFRATVLPRQLDENTYGRFYKVLLWAEEHRSDRDLEIYDISSTRLQSSGPYYHLSVPGLAEKRPSVLVGDRILVQPVANDVDKGKWFEGCVHFVRQAEVGMKFHISFRSTYSLTQLYRARFKLNRFPLRRQHQAMDTAFNPRRLLFPSVSADVQQVAVPNTNNIRHYLYNKLIDNNAAQLQAVATVVAASPGSLPFALFGPPGTGKTITAVECIRQILRINPKARVFACAPSNSAADLIAQRLTMLGPEVLFRFYAPSRAKSAVPDELLPFTATTVDGHFTAPPVASLKRYRVIVSTCVSASFAYGVGMPRGHFSHIFVDEAGQATEPEVMISIKTMADNETNIVLSGDPRQLGPIIRSPIARELGLEKSYLERIMENPAYDERRRHGLTVVKLVQNFRSHRAILTFPNDRFYGGDLRPCGEQKVINAYIGSTLLPNRRFPIIFHVSTGQDDREASSPSFFNAIEALIVKEYIQTLKADRNVRTTDSEIGVITPYHAQCQRIRRALAGVADEVKVGSVEEFQGQEKKIILISTVRSSKDYVAFDLKHTLGFVANPRRLNADSGPVAVTRAKSLLVIVGDPTVLSLDPLWRAFLNYIFNNGGWKGEPPVWDTNAPVRDDAKYDEEIRELGLADMNELARKLESYTLEDVDDTDDANVDRPWREVE